MKISPKENIQMPMKTVAALITMVAIGTWAFFGIQEKLNQHATTLQIMEKDLVENTEFRIKWPRGLLRLVTSRLGTIYVDRVII